MTTVQATNYVLADANYDDELARLRLLEELYDPTTAARLDAAGIQLGWRCLEVGAGAGSVTRMLADRVGPTGKVVAFDMNTRFLDAIDDPRIEVRSGDVCSDPLGNGYDLIHARYLLMHLRDPIAVATRLLAALRPGGVFIFEEGDFSGTGPTSDSSPYSSGARRSIEAICVAAQRKGLFHPYLGRTLSSQIGGATAIASAEIFRGDTKDAEWHRLSFEALRPHATEAGGVDDPTYDELMHCLRDPGSTFSGVARVAITGRRL